MNRDIKALLLPELLKLHVGILDELRDRKILRSANNPTGDLAEHLFCRAFGWNQAPNSMKSYDATDDAGVRYQIKGRRVNKYNSSRQLSAIRNFDSHGFDWLAVVLFDDAYCVQRAALVPRPVIADRGTHNRHTNSLKFIMTDSVWSEVGVQDVTSKIEREFI